MISTPLNVLLNKVIKCWCYFQFLVDLYRPDILVPMYLRKTISDLNYVVKTPDRGKNNQLCHVNMLKPYYDNNDTQNEVKPVAVL